MPSANEYSLSLTLPPPPRPSLCFSRTHLCNMHAIHQRGNEDDDDDNGRWRWWWWHGPGYNMNAIQVSLCATLFPHIYVFTSEHKTHLIWQTTTVGGRSQKHPVSLRTCIHSAIRSYGGEKEIVAVVHHCAMASTVAMRNKWERKKYFCAMESQ